jgi:glycosyltransferase involved in cell wall biosynthesis
MDDCHPITVAFLTRSLETGGAERQLTALAAGLDRRRFQPVVLCFYLGGITRGPLEAELRAAGVLVVDLAKRGRWDVLPFMLRLLKTLRELRPQVLHGYLPVPNILAAICKMFLPGMKVVFGVRSAVMDLARYDWLMRLTYSIERWFTPLADRIIVNSQAGCNHYMGIGFPERKLAVVFNGIDVKRFTPGAAGGAELRQLWGVPPDGPLVGLPGRLDAMKGHPIFLQAAAYLAPTFPAARFVCVGSGPAATLAELEGAACQLGIADRVVWAGPQDDMPTIYAALDVVCSASIGEGFPNVIAEAMACGVPCAVTDVGDSAVIVGPSGAIAAPHNPVALAGALGRLLGLEPEERRALGQAARQRIVERYSLESMLARTQVELEALVCDPATRAV